MGGGGGGGGGNSYHTGSLGGGGGGSAASEICFCYTFLSDVTSIDIFVGAGGEGAQGTYANTIPPSGSVGGTTTISFANETLSFYGGGGGGTADRLRGAFGGGASSSSGPGNSGTYAAAGAQADGVAGPYWPAFNGLVGGVGSQPQNSVNGGRGKNGVIIGQCTSGGTGGGGSRVPTTGNRVYAGRGGDDPNGVYIGGSADYSGAGQTNCGKGGGGGASARGNGGDGGNTLTDCLNEFTPCGVGGTGAGGGGGTGLYFTTSLPGRPGCAGGDGMVSIVLSYATSC